MKITEKIIETKDYVTKSNLPASDYVINPYIGCPHSCKYCYACFMKRFTKHDEEWGTFIDIKHSEKPVSKKKLQGKSVFMSSVTDCYNEFEKKHGITRGILEQLTDIECELTISTKSDLILRDIELLKKCRNLKVSVSINTLDESFRKDMDRASSIEERFDALRILHERGIHTVLFMSPIFPGVTDFREIIEASRSFVDEYWFENLNLRGSYKGTILSYINEKYPQYTEVYDDIYRKKNRDYWRVLAIEIEEYCREHGVTYSNFFYHEQLVKEKLSRN